MWEGPFEYYAWLDSDAIVCGDFTSTSPYGRRFPNFLERDFNPSQRYRRSRRRVSVWLAVLNEERRVLVGKFRCRLERVVGKSV